LHNQNQEVEKKNQEVEQARQALEEKAKQLALTSKYKSEFLANMSHELRTPLNSLLILSDQLSKNPDGNLTGKQTEFAKTIHSSGNDLLMLINDILDLSKIESGTVVVDVGELRLDDLQSYVERTFRHVAEAKNVDFVLDMADNLPKSIFTDAKRLQQIVKNLLSNAFKFTHYGQVKLAVASVDSGWNPENDSLNRATEVVAFSVTDTGIGIAPDKQQIIFEAFQQADGSTSRKYGGTGLGLAISRELSKLLGGEIRLISTPGKGSMFTLYLPQSYTPPRSAARKAAPVLAESVALAPSPLEANAALESRHMQQRAAGVADGGDAIGNVTVLGEVPTQLEVPRLVNEVGDDRDNLHPGDPVILIVENDLAFARFLLDAAHDKGFKGLVTSLGAAALAMAKEYKPEALTLDIFLPDIAGWRVLERLKNDIQTRHIPVCVVSTEEARERALGAGALAFVAKPIKTRETIDLLLDVLRDFTQRKMKSLLVVEPDAERRERILECIGADDIQVTTVLGGKEALQMLRERRVDCMILDPDLSDLTPEMLAEELEREPAVGNLPVIVFGNGEFVDDHEGGWKKLGQVCTVRRVHSPERLLDQACFFLHQDVAKLSTDKRRTLETLHQSDKVLASKRVLIVDDDIRNIFALSSVLEEHDMEILSAETGRDAIRILQNNPNIDIVLMDIMMPEMDGIDTMREIRKVESLKALPIVAVTAKAMKGDREKCIEAGAWDYLSKPVDTEQMLAVLRAWLHR
jgi:signal transduction histidine kinase/DNA-binding response OmpR family regulator